MLSFVYTAQTADWSHLMKKSLMKSFISGAVPCVFCRQIYLSSSSNKVCLLNNVQRLIKSGCIDSKKKTFECGKYYFVSSFVSFFRFISKFLVSIGKFI